MYTLDSDILAILLAIISFVIPAITAIREKKKKQGEQQQETADESPDELLHKQDVEELFNELLGLQIEVDEEEPAEAYTCQEQVMHQEAFDEAEMQQEYLNEGVHAVVGTALEEVPQVEEPVAVEPAENARSLKERVKANPKDMVLFAEILKPKFKEFEN